MKQNRELIVNMDNMITVAIDKENEDCVWLVYASTGFDYPEDYIVLGSYKTYDRATGILQDILRRADVGVRIYIMPEE